MQAIAHVHFQHSQFITVDMQFPKILRSVSLRPYGTLFQVVQGSAYALTLTARQLHVCGSFLGNCRSKC